MGRPTPWKWVRSFVWTDATNRLFSRRAEQTLKENLRRRVCSNILAFVNDNVVQTTVMFIRQSCNG